MEGTDDNNIPKGKRKKEWIVLFTQECEEYLKTYLDAREYTLPFVVVNSKGTGPVWPRTIQLKSERYTKNWIPTFYCPFSTDRNVISMYPGLFY
ncbi:hypothetical protein [Cytobacillus firmus]|uniref:hypothetical protein n=1 Tax=Cytobacillus firmus TaxID=1399 RepID=UPI0018CCCA76|nr:hypothetical protein [Cytobacillus firmus]MBG9587224.1 hypothetical protein [Cytobacillus firmus]